MTLIVSRFVLHTELRNFLKLTSRVKIFWEKNCWHHKCRLFIANIHLFQRFPIKEDTLFATLNGDIVYPVSLRLKEDKTRTLFSGTYPFRPNNGVHSPRVQLQEYICIQCFVYERIVCMVMIVVVPFSWPKTQTAVSCNRLWWQLCFYKLRKGAKRRECKTESNGTFSKERNWRSIQFS